MLSESCNGLLQYHTRIPRCEANLCFRKILEEHTSHVMHVNDVISGCERKQNRLKKQ
jgi:hypothetical protein